VAEADKIANTEAEAPIAIDWYFISSNTGKTLNDIINTIPPKRPPKIYVVHNSFGVNYFIKI
jgi:hypothetical protein